MFSQIKIIIIINKLNHLLSYFSKLKTKLILLNEFAEIQNKNIV